jgi:hypothetical protein
LNTYRTAFHAVCPANGARIGYSLTIETTVMVPVEQLNAKLEGLDHAFHEDLADQLYAEFGGRQRMTAVHDGVEITTDRGTADDKPADI